MAINQTYKITTSSSNTKKIFNDINISNKSIDKGINLLTSTSRVEIPFVKVVIGKYTFGVYDKQQKYDYTTAMMQNQVTYPNFIRSLEVKKINGQVNQYSLKIIYAITQDNDPNFFEKVFSSVSDSRKIVFSYGDLSLPTYIYKDEEAIITEIQTNFPAGSSKIEYTIKAVSSAQLLLSGVFQFKARYQKPSDIIKELLYNNYYGITDIFYGMRKKSIVNELNLIASDDKQVNIQFQTNITILDYLKYLVSCMVPNDDNKESLKKTGVYVLNIVDDVSGNFDGPYFTVKRVDNFVNDNQTNLDTYSVDIGYPSNNIVLGFNVDNNETYSLLYNYSKNLSTESYVERINDDGTIRKEYAPIISSRNSQYITTEADRTWWTNVTNYPVSATLSLKGLLKPTLLMSYINVNLYYYGKKHINSGKYIITEQIDTISTSGFKSQLKLTRVSGNEMK